MLEGSRVQLRRAPMGDGMRSPHLQRLQMEAYTAVLRALAATQMDWVRSGLQRHAAAQDFTAAGLVTACQQASMMLCNCRAAAKGAPHDRDPAGAEHLDRRPLRAFRLLCLCLHLCTCADATIISFCCENLHLL